jgi:L-iditol 2-dehydrogenase
MKAALLKEPGKMYVTDMPVPPCGDDQVLIKVKEVGICGSDIHYYNNGRIGDHIVKEPLVLGHESSGVVCEVGKNVKGFKPDDRVSVEPGVPCRSCEHCLEGRYNLCDDVQFLGVPPFHGAFREYLAHDSRFTHKLPATVSFTEGALVEPLSVAHNSILKVGLRPGDTIFIIGAGPIGIACLELAKIAGASGIFIAEISDYRLKMAEKLQATGVIQADKGDMIEKIKDLTSGRLCDCVIEASGSAQGIVTAILAAKKGGRIALVGIGDSTVRIPYHEILKKEVAINGIYRYAYSYRPVIELLAKGKINVQDWISHRFELSRIMDAMETAKDTNIEIMKMMIYME